MTNRSCAEPGTFGDISTAAPAAPQTKTPPERGFLKADARTRTGDPFITSEVLYQLSYVGKVLVCRAFAIPRRGGRGFRAANSAAPFGTTRSGSAGTQRSQLARSPGATAKTYALAGESQQESAISQPLTPIRRPRGSLCLGVKGSTYWPRRTLLGPGRPVHQAGRDDRERDAAFRQRHADREADWLRAPVCSNGSGGLYRRRSARPHRRRVAGRKPLRWRAR